MLGDDTISDSASLLESGVVDSTGIMQLVAFLETEFGVRVEDDELTADNLDSVDRIVGFVEAKQASPETARS
jgi:acyl carrier protein